VVRVVSIQKCWSVAANVATKISSSSKVTTAVDAKRGKITILDFSTNFGRARQEGKEAR